MNIRDNVKTFHEAIGVSNGERPFVPADDVVRLRARLITEEFIETMSALFPHNQGNLDAIELSLMAIIEDASVDASLIEFADGLADLEYVCEGAFLAFGIDSGPVHAEVQRANLAKVGGPVREDGKHMKPEGWTPPDIDVVLRRQGYTGL